jgi:hypothetical protein
MVFCCQNVCWSSCKVPTFLSDFNETQILWADFQKVLEISNFMKILSMGTALGP